MTWFDPSSIVGGLLIIMMVTLIVVLIVALRAQGPRRRFMLSAVAAGGVAFQIFHVAEHGLQLGYWVANTNEKPWLTPWAESGRDGLGYWCQILPGEGSDVARGAEMLHVVGNGIFMVAVIAMVALARTTTTRTTPLRGLVWFQGFHLVEHITLTVTLFVNGTPWGASTLFGSLSGTELSSHRVWWHFTVNALATGLGVMVLRSLWTSGALVLRPERTTTVRTSAWSRFAGLWFGGMLGLIALPAIIGKIVGDPAPPEGTRNIVLGDFLVDPGMWWHVVDPFVLLPTLTIAAMWWGWKHAPPPSEPALDSPA